MGFDGSSKNPPAPRVPKRKTGFDDDVQYGERLRELTDDPRIQKLARGGVPGQRLVVRRMQGLGGSYPDVSVVHEALKRVKHRRKK